MIVRGTRSTQSRARLALALLVFPALLGLTSCNIFAPISKPSGDAQLLSAARACFDRGDYDCAKQNYEALSSSDADIANTEETFLTLDEAGVTMGIFIDAFSSGKAQDALNKLVASLSTNSPGKALRQTLFDAYQNGSKIGTTTLKGLVHFTASMALAAELLAESEQNPGTFLKNDIAHDGLNCAKSTTCFSDTTCDPETGLLVDSTTGFTSGGLVLALSAATDTDITGALNVNMLYSSLNAVISALKEVGGSGKIGSAASSITSSLTNAATSVKNSVTAITLPSVLDTAYETPASTPPTSITGSPGPNAFIVSRCFRQELLKLGVGN